MRRLVEVAVDGTIFSIKGWQAHKLALEAGLRPTFNGVRGAWVADTKKLPQFVAYCQHRNVALTIEDEGARGVLRDSENIGKASITSSRSGLDRDDHRSDAVQFDLFDGPGAA